MLDAFVFIGNPAIGAEIAPNLVKAGFKAAPDMESAQVVFTFCTSQEEAESVYFESDGIIAKAQPGVYLIDFGSATPTFAKEISAMAAISDMHAVEAPLFVRDATIERAYADPSNLVALVSGDGDDASTVRPLLEACAGSIRECGDPGLGQLAKCSFTLQRVAQVVSCMEAWALCRTVLDGASSSKAMEHVVATETVPSEIGALCQAVASGQFTGSYSVDVMMGELSSALSAADDADLIVPQAEAAEYLLQLLSMIGGVDMSPAALSLLYGDEAACAEYGLDWTRAEEAYTSMGEQDEYDDDDDGECDCGHDHGSGHGFPGGFGGYSAN
jgi:3-hydroxyisobutyrate dehydrogenase